MTIDQRIAKAKQKIIELKCLLDEGEYKDAELISEYLEHSFNHIRSVLNQKNNQQ